MGNKMETLPVVTSLVVVLGFFVQNSEQYTIAQECNLSKPELEPCPADEFCYGFYCVPCADICDFESGLMDVCHARCPERFEALQESAKSKTTSTTRGYKTENVVDSKTTRETDAAPTTQASTEDYTRTELTLIWILVGVISVLILTLAVLFGMVCRQQKPRRPTQQQQTSTRSAASSLLSGDSGEPTTIETTV